jgi:histidinol-phosphate aminotransferase
MVAVIGASRPGGAQTSSLNDRTRPLSSPSVDPLTADPVPVRADIGALAGYHSAQVDADVRLNTNESPFPPPEEWLAEYLDALADVRWNRYPDRRASELRHAIAGFHGVPDGRVFAANGSNEVIQSLLLAYAGPGRTVVTFEPTYQLHAHISRITGASVTTGERRDDFTLEPEHAADVIVSADPAVTFLCSPNNPTGVIESPEVLDAVLSASRGLVVVDEAYAEFSSWTALDRVTDDGRLVVVRTFSKTWSMAAARLGYAVAPSWVVVQLDKVALPYHLDAAKQLAGTLAVRHVADMERRVSALVEERGRVAAALAELSSAGVEAFPSGSNFILVRFQRHDARHVWQRLVADGVLVRDCSGWPRLDGCLRVTIGLRAENDRFLAVLGDIVATPASSSATIREPA